MPYILPASLVQEYVCDLVIFLFKIGESLLDATVRPYVIGAVCSDLYGHHDNRHEYWYHDDDGHYTRVVSLMRNASHDVCSRLHELPEVEANVQQHAAGVLVAHRVLVNVPAVILGLFCGAWSDVKGRKLPMMAPSAGSCLAVTLYLASTQAVNIKVPLLLAGAATQGIFGKTPVMTMAVNSHVSDTSHKEQRTRRLGRILASSFLGMFLGSLLAGLLQDLSNLLITLCVVSVCHALCVVTVLSVVTETVSEFEDEERVMLRPDNTIGVKDVTPSSEEEEEEAVKKKEKKHHGLFSWHGIRDSVLTVAKSREGNKRAIIVIAILALTLNTGLKVGDQDVTVLFVHQPPLSWPDSGYGYLIAVDYATMGISLLLLLPILSDTLQMPDISIVMVGVACKLVRTVWAGFCTETWMVFTSVVSGALGGLLIPGLRSVLSKTVHENEVGKLFSILASMETLAKLVGSSVFTGVYALTVHTTAAAAYLMEAAVYLIVLALMLWLGQMLREDGAYGLLLNLARPYFSLDSALSGLGKRPTTQQDAIPRICTDDVSSPVSDDQEQDGRHLFPMGASTP